MTEPSQPEPSQPEPSQPEPSQPEPSQQSDELLARIRATVAERRTSGQYPPNLEGDLDAHFQRIVAAGRKEPPGAVARQRIQAARDSAHFAPERIATSSNLPAGEALHKAMSRVFRRQANGILLQVQEFADRILEALDELAAVADTPEGHVHSDLVQTLDAHSETLAALAAAAAPAPGGVARDSLPDLLRRMVALEDARSAHRWRPWFGQERFEEVFDQGRLAELGTLVAERLEARTPVFCVVAAGATGGETADPEVPATSGGLAELAGSGDATWGGIVALRADERLTAQRVVDLVALSYERLAPDGRLLISVGSPPLMATGADVGPRPRFNPTLGPFLPARYMAFVCREAGFAAVEVEDWAPDGYLVVATR